MIKNGVKNRKVSDKLSNMALTSLSNGTCSERVKTTYVRMKELQYMKRGEGKRGIVGIN
jgi:hypothetical protein